MVSKTIVTHVGPDFDGILAIWLLKRFHDDFKNAQIKFTNAGSTIDGKPAGSNPDVVHVDTGGGPFDHHDSNDYTCAAKLVWDWLKKEYHLSDLAVERMVAQAVAIDHAQDILWPDASDDRYDLALPALISGMKMVPIGSDLAIVELTLELLDALYAVYKAKVEAEEILAKGQRFSTRWGQALACLTTNETVLQLGEKIGYTLVVRKDPNKGFVRIYARNDRGVDLTPAWKKFQELDPQSTWFLHASKCLLLNGSNKRTDMVPTKLSLDEVVKVLAEI